MQHSRSLCSFLAATGIVLIATSAPAEVQVVTLQSRHANILIDGKGLITSITSRQSGKEYSSAGHPSPLLSLHVDGRPNDQLLVPVSAAFRAGRSALPSATMAVSPFAPRRPRSFAERKATIRQFLIRRSLTHASPSRQEGPT